MPSLTQLQYVLAVDRLGHFGRAAESCNVAQPTLSAQLHKAEQELGITIFDRLKKPVAATPQGKEVVALAQEVVSAHERLVVLAKDQSEELSGELSLGVIPTLAPYVLPWFLPGFAREYPKVDVFVHERPTDQVIDDLNHGRLDAGLLATPLGESGIHERVCFYDPFYLYAHPAESLLKRGEINAKELDPEKIWLLEDGHCLRNQVINYCGLRRTRRQLKSVSFAAGSFETLRNLIDAAEGYTLVPESFARTLPKSVRARQIRSFTGATPTREVSLVHRKGHWKEHLFDALGEVLHESLPRAIRQVDAEGDVIPIRQT
jgi:LysR family hydrogen peroxide-inducible transcriptional activator